GDVIDDRLATAGDHLEGHQSIQVLLSGLVYNAHSPLAELFQDHVTRDMRYVRPAPIRISSRCRCCAATVGGRAIAGDGCSIACFAERTAWGRVRQWRSAALRLDDFDRGKEVGNRSRLTVICYSGIVIQITRVVIRWRARKTEERR